MINRRNFLKNASLFTLGGLMAGKVGNAVAAQPATSAAFEATAAKNIGLQIYSLGDELYKDVPGGMKKLKKMGYQTIELAGYGKGKIRDIELMDFKKMADDAGIQHQSFDVLIGHGGDGDRITLMEGIAVVFTFLEHSNPRQTRLLTLQADHLKEFFTIFLRHAPFLVVIVDIQLILAYPTATFHPSSPLLILILQIFRSDWLDVFTIKTIVNTGPYAL